MYKKDLMADDGRIKIFRGKYFVNEVFPEKMSAFVKYQISRGIYAPFRKECTPSQQLTLVAIGVEIHFVFSRKFRFTLLAV